MPTGKTAQALDQESLIAATNWLYNVYPPYYETTTQPRYNTGVRYPSYLRRLSDRNDRYGSGGYESPVITNRYRVISPTSLNNTTNYTPTRSPYTTSSSYTDGYTYISPYSSSRYNTLRDPYTNTIRRSTGYRASTRNTLGNYSRYRQPKTRQIGSRYDSAPTITTTTLSTNSTDYADPVITVRPLTIDRDFIEGNQLTTPIFQIGFTNNASAVRNTLPPVYELRKLKFALQDRQGVFIDFSDFFLDIEGEQVYFGGSGDITVSIQGARVAQGESKSLAVSLGIRDTSRLPRRSGSLRLVVQDAEVTTEFSGRPANYRISGNKSSQFVSFMPTPGAQPGKTPSVAGNTTVNIFGKNLSAGSSEKVLALRLQANYDDIQINNITVREVLSNGGVDGWSNKLEVIDEATGQVLESSRFTGGKAVFNFRPAIIIDRGNQSLLSFRLYLSDPIRNTSGSNQFKLMIDNADIDAYSYSTGNTVTSKIVDIDSETFTISGGSGGISAAGSQPPLVAFGNLAPLFRFNISNPSTSYISVGRMSFIVNPSETQFAGGSISTGDFALTQFSNGQEYGVGFAPVQASGNTVKFDHSSGLNIPPGQTYTFTLQVALDDLPGSNPSATVQILGDSVYGKGNLSQVKTSGANFVWSDNSGSPHSASTTDWFTGYRFSGITSNPVVIRGERVV
ncbi:MAG TPA: hypothetical protein VIT68_04290 [Candidatus Gracilibacteria bacterium]